MNFMNHHKWLVESNLLTDEMRDNIAMAAYCIVENVIDAATVIDFEDHTVYYRILLPNDLVKNLNLLKKFENDQSLGFFEMRRLKKFLKEKQNNDESGMGYNLEKIANTFVQAYLSDKWKTKVEYRSVKTHDEAKDKWLHSSDYQQSN